jgi:DNA-directed RNA polymerase specialized sigma subunit
MTLSPPRPRAGTPDFEEQIVTLVPFTHDMEADESSDPEFLFSRQERVVILEQAGLSCTSQQRLLLLLLYGETALSLTEIADQFQVSRSAVTQMHATALKSLRASLARMGIESRDQI